MKYFDQIFNLEIKGNVVYNYDDYIQDKELNLKFLKEKLNSESKISADSNVEPKYFEINLWPLIRDTYKAKVIITTFQKKEITIPLPLLFIVFDDKTVLRFLAILDSFQPEICYEYYCIGEKYGKQNSTIVKQNNILIKNFFIKKGNNFISCNDFLAEKIESFSEIELDNLVSEYFQNIESNKLEQDIQDMERDESKIKYYNSRQDFDDTYYNDQLDLDQQDSEFWNNI